MKSIFQHLFILLLTFISSQTSAQSPDDNKKNSVSTYLGIGAGLDYGGFGIKAEVVPSKYIGIFAGVGYNLADLSYNAGLSAKILPDKKVSPTIMAMYGYNGAIIVKYEFSGIKESNTYYGFTAGAGCEIKNRGGTKLNFAVLVPFRRQAYDDRIDELENIGVKFNSSSLPIALSLGYSIRLNSKKNKL